MPKATKQEKPPREEADIKPARIRGVGNPESHSQDADRHHRNEHQKSEK
jgi:hypothetical protein